MTEQLRLTRASDIEPEARGEQRPEWGPWHVDRATFVLWATAGGYRYEVDLEDCTTSARLLDWVCQVAGKEWGEGPAARNSIVAGLVTALSDVLAPQAHLCSWGKSKQLSRPAIRHLVNPEGSAR